MDLQTEMWTTPWKDVYIEKDQVKTQQLGWRKTLPNANIKKNRDEGQTMRRNATAKKKEDKDIKQKLATD